MARILSPRLFLTISLSLFVIFRIGILALRELGELGFILQTLRPSGNIITKIKEFEISTHSFSTMYGPMHIFTKAMAKDNRYLLRGFVYLEPHANNTLDRRVPVKSSRHVLNFRVGINTSGSTRWAYMQYWECPDSSFPCESTSEYLRYPWFSINIDAFDDTTHLVFNEFNMRIPLSPLLISASQYSIRKKTFQHILSTSYNRPPDFFSMLNDYSTHLDKYGFVGITHYCRREVCQIYRKDYTIQRLLQLKRLKLIEWDAVVPVEGWTYYDQALQYNHAILSYSGTGTYIMLADLDEYIAMPSSVWERECVMELLKVSLCVAIPAYVVYSDHVRNGVSSLLYWEPKSSSHKSIIDPDASFGFYVHEGRSCRVYNDLGCSESVTCAAVNASCAKFGHDMNMFRPRASRPDDVHVDNPWERVGAQPTSQSQIYLQATRPPGVPQRADEEV